MQGTTDHDFIEQAKLDWDESIESLKDALEACYMNGFYDDIGGDVEAPTGHYYRIERWIVVTDSQGFTDIQPFYDEDEAKRAIDKLDAEYSRWEGDDE